MAAAFVLKMGLFLYLFSHSPSTPNPENGEIYPLSNHGYIFYVTRLQNVLQDALIYVFGVLMFFIVVLRIYWEVSSPQKNARKSNGAH